MKIKSRKLFFQLLNAHHQMIEHLFDMGTELLSERFLPIKVFNDELEWLSLFVWDNEKEILHGPFEAEREFSQRLIIKGYKWAGEELYVYYYTKIDACITGLPTGEIKFEKC